MNYGMSGDDIRENVSLTIEVFHAILIQGRLENKRNIIERMLTCMKKVLVAAVVGILVLSSVVYAEPFTIRNGIKIGDSKETVMSLETLAPISDKSQTLIEQYNETTTYLSGPNIVFDSSEYIFFGLGEIAGVPESRVEYHFIDNRLTCVAYQFRVTNASLDYSVISSALRSKYGESISNGSYLKVGIARKYGDARYAILGGGIMPELRILQDKICEEWVIGFEAYDIKIEHMYLMSKTNEGEHFLSYSVIEKLDIVNVDSGDI